MNTRKIIALTAIVLGLSLVLYGVAFAGWFSSSGSCDTTSHSLCDEMIAHEQRERDAREAIIIEQSAIIAEAQATIKTAKMEQELISKQADIYRSYLGLQKTQ